MTVGQEIAIYKWDQLSNSLAIVGNRITPIDQNCSKSVVTMVFGLPPVMSETVYKRKKKKNRFTTLCLICRLKGVTLHIIPPAVYIWQQQTADRHLKKTCNSYVYTKPVIFPQKICVIIPKSITLFGLKLKMETIIHSFTSHFFLLDKWRIFTVSIGTWPIIHQSEHQTNEKIAYSPPKYPSNKLNYNP